MNLKPLSSKNTHSIERLGLSVSLRICDGLIIFT